MTRRNFVGAREALQAIERIVTEVIRRGAAAGRKHIPGAYVGGIGVRIRNQLAVAASSPRLYGNKPSEAQTKECG